MVGRSSALTVGQDVQKCGAKYDADERYVLRAKVPSKRVRADDLPAVALEKFGVFIGIVRAAV